MKEEVKKLIDRFQFAGVLYLFFPTLLDALYRNVSALTENSLLSYSTIIAFFIANYVILELSKRRLEDWLVKILAIIVTTQIIAFIPVLVIFGQVPEPVHFSAPSLYIVEFIFMAGLTVILWAPIVSCVLLVVGAFSTKKK
ncbi:MAG: hypothetical protein WCO12_00470 [bacterium]